MLLHIDNYDGAGLRDYTANTDASHLPRILRKLNQPAELHLSLVATGNIVAPSQGARIILSKSGGQILFTGYITAAPEFEHLGWGERGPQYRYNIEAKSDETLLDEKRLPARSPFVDRSAGDALSQLAEDAVPGLLDTSAVQNLDTLPAYDPDPQLTWSEHAERICTLARTGYRAINGALLFSPLGASEYTLEESDSNFSPQALLIQPANAVVNDATIVGDIEPQDFVTDYFVGDGLTSRFHLSQTPFTRFNRTIFNEEYAAATLDQTHWQTIDPGAHSSVSAGKLQIAGGDGSDGTTTVSFVEKLELGGATVLQHGDVVFNASSSGILGGLYLGNVLSANCIAGFQISASGSASQIQALINGALTGAPLTTTADHHYVLTTRIYSQEIYRLQQIFHSAANPAGSGLGGTQVSANARLVLEVHDIDPANPGTMVAPSTVLYDGVIFGAPAFCTYALVNSPSLFCSIAFTRMIEAADTQVRSALPGQPFRTRLVGPLSSGGECNIYSGNVLDFFSSYVPALNEQIEVRYRGRGRAMARVINPTSVTAEAHGSDDGVRGVVRHIKLPAARTSSDCESAALALLSGQAGPGWTGEYKTWNDFLPGNATDIFPGDALNVNIPTRGAVFQAIVNEVEVFCEHPADDHSVYKIIFADAAARNPAFEFENAKSSSSLKIAPVTNTQVGTTTLAELTNAAITAADATTASIDTGIPALIGGGFEVRWSDTGWGPYNDQNLAGRFTTQTFTLPRLARVQDYYLRQFDGSTPTKYSRYSAALHLDRPLT